MMIIIDKNIRQIGNAIKTMADNWNNARVVSDDLLNDIEVDLEYALKALRAYRAATVDKVGKTVKLKRDIEAEGETIRKGEIVAVEKVYVGSLDVYHYQTGTLFWVREHDIEFV